ncbi:MAG: hypothetical protein F6J93_31940 [Oscillatoria sp. SIO1A7]|nr:hypothetical protein [Oscillatoria sp. SIO1A7]
MNTPAHIVINLAVLGRKDKPENNIPIAIGAFLPDLPMFLFYAYEKLWQKTPEWTIWSESYYNPSWQDFFDIFNSIPLVAIAGLMAYYFGSGRLVALFASMGLHSIGDFPVHNDDAHRHFFPFSSWRFESPFSYWDYNHHGRIVSFLEVVAVIVCCIIICRRQPSVKSYLLTGSAIAMYVIYWGYAVLTWG